MSSTWRVLLSPKFWDQKAYEMAFLAQPEVRRLAQSKGKCPMKRIPKKGDIVCFVLKGHIVMRGIVDSDGFDKGVDHQHHSCNIGDNRLHAIPDEFVWVRIIEVGLSEATGWSGQRTWARMPSQVPANPAIGRL